MRSLWIVSASSSLMSMILLTFIFGQYQMLTVLNQSHEKSLIRSGELDNQRRNDELFKATLEKMVLQWRQVAENLEATLAKLGPATEKMKVKRDACQAEKKVKVEELAALLKESTVTRATLKAESDAWKKEINTLTAQLTGYRPVCDYVKDRSLARKLCGPKTS
ncbi:uncharacterized protein AB9X84_006151 isoform 2-T2 [Acanthopagrus schlegelii]